MSIDTPPQQETRQLIVIGAGGTAANVVNLALSLNYSIFGFVSSNKASETLFNLPIFGALEEIQFLDKFHFCIAIGENYRREKYAVEVLDRFPTLNFPALIHPSANIGPFAKIDRGTLIMPHSVIGTNAIIGSFCLLGAQTYFGHDSYLSDYASLGPAATFAGNGYLGRRSAVGLGAKVREKVKIGDDSVVGPNSFVNKDLPSNVVAFGSPAKIIKQRKQSDSYLR